MEVLMIDHGLTIRAATPSDANALERLARLDSRPRLGGRALLAERDGVAIAAVALTSGSVVADPFHPAADAVRLLRFRRYQLLRQGGDSGPAWSLMRRLAPATAAAN
jgi:hypothetical protein